ncbi:MAG: DUF4105 domain-containing protein [Elusimicrobia bacterium]|nr:DUF4105 domain-containing protein [Elusimicrobiota bacterium]
MRPRFFAPALLAAALSLISVPGAKAAGDYPAVLQARARSLSLAHQKEWLNLLHYGWTLTGFHSQVSPGPFFLSPQGRTNAQAELDADLAAFFQDAANPDEQAQCRFPARYAWLDSKLRFNPDKLTPRSCPLLRRWKRKLDAGSVSVVFASAYLDNPSSMYGHTFLLVRHAGRPAGERLLDYAVNYAARADTNNGALFAIDGLTGVFPGRYSAMPYYLKVQEYSNLESRDLWEYRLNLSSGALDRLMDHIWEMRAAVFPYYFFNRNCSYELLPLLDAADPELNLARGWPLYVIPLDTIRRLDSHPGLVARRTYRPSHVSRLLYDRSLLKPGEIKIATSLARRGRGWSALATLSEKDQARTLSSASEYLEYLIDYQKDAAPALLDRQHRIYVALAKTGVVAPQNPVPPPAPPESGHLSGRLNLGYGFLNGRGYEDFSVRPALHDPLDPPRGYAPWSALEMFGLDVRHEDKSNRTYINSLELIHILSLSPLDAWIRKPSWEVSAGLRQAEELGKAPWASQYFGATVGSGAALRIFRLPAVLYALGELDGGAGAAFKDDSRLGPGVSGGLLIEPQSRWRLWADASYWRYVLGNLGGEVRLRAGAALDLSERWSLQLRAQRYGLSRETSLDLVRYF